MASDTPPADKPKAAGDPIDTRLVRRLADILKDTDLSEIEVERGDLKIRVARLAPVAAPTQVYTTAPQLAQTAPVVPPVTPPAEPMGETLRGDQVKSPMVGTVYLQPQPGAKAFVQVGDKVNAGQTLLIIEAMKTMNPVPAPRAGVIVQLLIEDAQPIEFGEPLIIIE